MFSIVEKSALTMNNENMTTSSDLKNRNNNSNGTGTGNSSSKSDELNKKTECEDQSYKLSRNSLIKLKSYLIALRVWSLSASIIPTILGKLKKTTT